jgi:ParB family chromosome partitioning protein
MRKLSEQGKLDMDAVFGIMTKPKPNQQEKVTLPYQKLPVDKIRRYTNAEPTPKVVEDFLLKAVEHYCRYLQRQRDREAR